MRSKIGHNARSSCSSGKTNHIAEDETYRVDKDDWTTDRIHSKHQKTHSLGTSKKNELAFYTATLLVNNRPIKFEIYTGASMTLLPELKFKNTTGKTGYRRISGR